MNKKKRKPKHPTPYIELSVSEFLNVFADSTLIFGVFLSDFSKDREFIVRIAPKSTIEICEIGAAWQKIRGAGWVKAEKKEFLQKYYANGFFGGHRKTTDI